MMREIVLAPSILAADFNFLGKQLETAKNAGAGWVHIDVMDGRFVPNISVGPCVVESLRGNPALRGVVFDVHLMVERPADFVKSFAEAGADVISVHAETPDVSATLELIKSSGKKAALAISPETGAEAVFPYISDVSMVLVMSVCPGFGGRELLPETLGKARKLRDYADSRGVDVDIEMDGGINAENAESVIRSGVNVIVAGTAAFGGDIAENVSKFIKIFRQSR